MTSGEFGPVVICAAGESSRMRPYMDSLGFPPDYPKGLLPVSEGGSETFLGRVVRQASAHPIGTPPILVVNAKNGPIIETHDDIPPVDYSYEQYAGSLDPLFYRLMRTGRQVLGAASDHFTDATWDEFIARHASGAHPVSVLVGEPMGASHAAIFNLDNDGGVIDFTRPEEPTNLGHRNIGMYVLDPESTVLAVLRSELTVDPMCSPGTDHIFSQLVKEGLVGAIADIGSIHFNVNSGRELDLARRALASSVVVS